MPKKIINLFDLEELFEKNLPSPIAGYYKSGARDEITLKKNREIFNKYELLPKLLRDVSNIDTSVKVRRKFKKSYYPSTSCYATNGT